MTNTRSSLPSAWQNLAEINLSGQPGADRLARNYVASAVRPLNLSPADLERLKTAITEAVLKAIEHGHHYRFNLPVSIRLRVSYRALAGQVTDRGNTPDLTAKVSVHESSRGWGFFLIERIVDDTQTADEDMHHSIELFLYRE